MELKDFDALLNKTMKMYYTLAEERGFDTAFMADSCFVGPFTQFELWRGHSVSDWDPNYYFKATKPDNNGILTDRLFNAANFLIFSEKLRDLLESNCISGIQYLPVKVFRYDKSLVSGYSVVNTLQALPALDVNRSELSMCRFPRGTKEISWIKKAVFKPEIIEGVDIFRLQEFPVSLYVSERFKTVFEKNKCTGFDFREP